MNRAVIPDILKNYEKNDTIPVVVIDEEKEKALKIGYMTLYAKLFMTSQK